MEAKDSTQIAVPSKKAVRRAGEILRDPTAPHDEIWKALITLSEWRRLHTYPINTFQAYLRGKTKREYPTAIVAQRLKRFSSILNKLVRYPDMKMDRMQDIGGIRVILNSISDVYSLHSALIKSKRFKHKAMTMKDYIESPKKDGYRSVHQVFGYMNRQHPELNVLKIEIQIRTKLQHSWATAVETLGIVEKSSFKTGEGSEQFKQFFKLSSALFSLDEKKPVLDEFKDVEPALIVQMLNDIESELQITSKLRGLAISARHIDATSQSGYHLMELDIEKNNVSLIPFSDNQLDKAEFFYRSREQETKDNPNISVVLISAGNIKDIKKAYPNYFLDTNLFVKNLKRICEKYKSVHD